MNHSLEEYSPAELAAKCINQTNKPVFLTGKAGTGKTTFLRQIIAKTHKNAIIVAWGNYTLSIWIAIWVIYSG